MLSFKLMRNTAFPISFVRLAAMGHPSPAPYQVHDFPFPTEPARRDPARNCWSRILHRQGSLCDWLLVVFLLALVLAGVSLIVVGALCKEGLLPHGCAAGTGRTDSWKLMVAVGPLCLLSAVLVCIRMCAPC